MNNDRKNNRQGGLIILIDTDEFVSSGIGNLNKVLNKSLEEKLLSVNACLEGIRSSLLKRCQ